MLYDSIDKLIGNTPTLKFNGITALDGEKRLFGKMLLLVLMERMK